jgi:hypothetical protein
MNESCRRLLLHGAQKMATRQVFISGYYYPKVKILLDIHKPAAPESAHASRQKKRPS